MRTPLTLYDDVAARLEAWRARQDLSFQQAVNTASRRVLGGLSRPKAPQPFRT